MYNKVSHSRTAQQITQVDIFEDFEDVSILSIFQSIELNFIEFRAIFFLNFGY